MSAAADTTLARCARCGQRLAETWDEGGALCLQCGIERELFERDSRWARSRGQEPCGAGGHEDPSAIARIFAGLARALGAAGRDARRYRRRSRTRTRTEAKSVTLPAV